MRYSLLIVIIFLLSHLSTSAQSIFNAVCQGNVNKVDSLLQHNPLDIKDDRGRSLLHWAVGCQQEVIFDFLIKKGIPLNQEDNQEQIPMHVAIRRSDTVSFGKLQQLQPDDTWVNQYGMSLLVLAILNKNKPMVAKLTEAGVEVNQVNERGSTPLEVAKRTEANDIYKLLLSLGADESKIRIITMKGKYMGQPPPTLTPKLFAPNFISTEESEFGSIFNAEGTEFYYGVDVNGKNEIRYSQIINNQWSKPKAILSHERYGYNDPFLSPNEDRLYCISNRALDGIGKRKDIDIWYIEKNKKGWSVPINAGSNINSEGNEYYISFTREGTMYFSSNGKAPKKGKKADHDIYYANFVNGAFQPPVILGSAINTDAYEADVFIAPDESYIIFCSTREGGFGRGDLYISFKQAEGNWSKAANMGKAINTSEYEYCPFVTKDGKYLFYTSNQDIYWVSTAIFDELREK